MSDTSNIGAAIAVTAAINAAASAEEARCHQVMAGFENVNATVEQKQAYAKAVLRLHPPEESKSMARNERIQLKIFTVVTIFAVIYGGVKGYNSHHYTDGGQMVDTFMYAIGHGLMPLFGVLVFWGIYAIFKFLFSSDLKQSDSDFI